MTIARQLYDIFFEGCTHYSIAKISAAGKLAYYTEEGIPTLAMIEEHLEGTVVLGAYNLLPNNHVRWIAFDVDSSDLEQAKVIARRICDFLGAVGFLIEYSGNKGYHIYILFDSEVPANKAKEIGDYVRDELGLPKSGDPHVEVYPKQEKRTETNPLGSLIRLPLGFHPVTRRKVSFVDIENGWENGPELPADKLLAWRLPLSEVETLVKAKDHYEQTLTLLKPYWTDGQRHQIALSVSGLLSTLGWTEEAVIDLVTDLTNEAGGELSNLKECVTDTYEKVYNNQAVRGFEGLAEFMPTKALHDLVTIASSEKFPATLQIADRFRLGKGAQFQKVRWVASSAVTYFKNNGNLVQDRNGFIYFTSTQTRDTLIFGGNDYLRYMHTHFGINPADSFGKQVLESVRLYSEEQAPKVSVNRRSHWDRKAGINYINLGGPEVYAVGGNRDKIELIYNGDEGIFFLNTEDGMRLPNLLSEEIIAVDPWDFLVNRLNFNKGGQVQATPAQQKELLKALIMSYFFGEAMPTRPILAILAVKGAGKTTAARNILRFIEGLGEDVTGILPDKPDALRSSMMEHKILVLDNLEKTNPPWLTDVLNRVSTGGHIEVRTLYKTNALTKVVPNTNIIITATHMPFSEETVFSRILPIELAFLTRYVQEEKIQIELEANQAAFWKGMLYCIADVVKELNKTKNQELQVQMRLADFSAFCSRIQSAAFVNGKELMAGLNSMTSRQNKELVKSSPFIQVLEIWMKQRPDEVKEWMTMSQLFTATKRIGSVHKVEWRWSNAQGLSRHIQAMEPMLKAQYGFRKRPHRTGGNEILQYRFNGGNNSEEETEEQDEAISE